MDPDELIRRLGLQPHPEGGHYFETFRAEASDGGRSPITVIYFLLRADEQSRWHRIDATEVWQLQAGSPLQLDIAIDGERMSHRLGPDLLTSDVGHAIVPPHAWQQARPLGDWSLLCVTVAPGFEFQGFEMAPDGFEP